MKDVKISKKTHKSLSLLKIRHGFSSMDKLIASLIKTFKLYRKEVKR